MKYSVNELGTILFLVNQDKEGKPRRYSVTELAGALDIVKKIKVHVVDDKILPGDYEVDLTTDEKSKLLKDIDAMEWAAGDAEIVFSLKEKLK